MISIDHVSKRFGALSALDDVSLRVARGERLALAGPNGSGKTTLLRALCGLVRVSGHISIAGHPVATHPQRALAQLAYMPQCAPPLEVPTRELVRAYCELRHMPERRVHTLAERLGLAYGSVERTPVRDLSGGMKQKLLAALALACDAPVLVCDEPTASLDQAARAAFFALVRERPEDSVLVLCSHRADDLHELVERVIELSAGRVVQPSSSAAPSFASAPALTALNPSRIP